MAIAMKRLQQFRQLKQFRAIAALYEYAFPTRLVAGYGLLHFLHIIIFLEVASRLAKLLANEPHVV